MFLFRKFVFSFGIKESCLKHGLCKMDLKVLGTERKFEPEEASTVSHEEIPPQVPLNPWHPHSTEQIGLKMLLSLG